MKRIIMIAAVVLAVILGLGYLAPAPQAQGQDDVQTGAQPGLSPAAAPAGSPAASSAATDMELYMHIGSPVAFANGKLLSLDKDSPDLAPVIYKERTLVPLRVIGEYFGAEVGYDAAGARATVRTADHEAVFPVGKNYYILDGAEKPLDTETILISGRAFVPLREICREALGYGVDYRDSLIYIARTAKLTEESIREAKSRIGMYVRAADLDTLNRYMEASGGYRLNYGRDDGFFVMEQEVPMMDRDSMEALISAPAPAPGGMTGSGSVASGADSSAAPPAAAPQAPKAEAGYSTTNIQVEGIDEGDILKTDGKYIYIIAGNRLKVVEAAGMTLAGTYDLGDNARAQEMYVDRDRVIVVGARYEDTLFKPAPGGGMAMDAYIGGYYGNTAYTFVRVLDTANMGSIKSFRYYEVEGYMNTSRKKGDYVYLVSGFYEWRRGGGGDLRPLTGENGVLAPMPLERIMIMPGGYGEGFLTVSAVNIRDASEKAASETIAGSGYVTYMSNDNLYVAVNDGRYTAKQTTNIARFTIDGARIGYAGSGGIEGGLDGQFSMDEHRGYLRVATTLNWPQTYNNLYVLDANMDVTGKVAGYAEGERIYSVRFMGDRGYVVTFRQVDPLFVFDLSNPSAPKITGELKVPGFSTYLHPVSENVILGVGRDVYDIYRTDKDGNQIVIGQNTGGIKISLFDVSDMGKPREIDTLILGDYGYSELLDNHRAAMFKTSDSLLGFCGHLQEERSGKFFQGAMLISYAGDKLSERGRLDYENPYAAYGKEADLLYTGERLAYIGDILYYLQDGMLRCFDFQTLTPKASLTLTR